MDEPSGRDSHGSREPAESSSADELSDAALDAVVGGIGVDAALARAAAYDAGRLA